MYIDIVPSNLVFYQCFLSIFHFVSKQLLLLVFVFYLCLLFQFKDGSTRVHLLSINNLFIMQRVQ